jgi:methionyl-tRNA synthetase
VASDKQSSKKKKKKSKAPKPGNNSAAKKTGRPAKKAKKGANKSSPKKVIEKAPAKDATKSARGRSHKSNQSKSAQRARRKSSDQSITKATKSTKPRVTKPRGRETGKGTSVKPEFSRSNRASKQAAESLSRSKQEKSSGRNKAKTVAEPIAPAKATKRGGRRPVAEPVGKSVERTAASSRGNRFYITTAIAYPNGTPHIGHAYEAIATDALARFQRLDGKDVFFLTGTDEHGLKMIQTAQNEGLTPAALANRNAARFKEMDERLDVSFDRFIRTTEEQHHRSSQEIWRRMAENGDIYLDSYSGWYSVRDEAYYAEDETTLGEDGVRRGPQGTPVEWVEEKSYFFRLSAYQDKLLALYDAQPEFIGPDARKNEVVSFVRSGLRDLSISRTTFDWGVKVPDSPEHVMYVWVDALTNYITGVGFPDESNPSWLYWPADVHIIGKDIIRFHAVYWPAFLMSAGLPLQKRVYAHGFLFNRGEKMSKSVGNVVDPFNLADQYGVDQIRYFFLREVPFGQDGNYNHEAIVARINADLANDLGNLAQRSLSMVAKQLSGVLPEPGALSDTDKAILAEADAMIAASRNAMTTQQIHQWLNTVWSVVAEANRYFAGEAPWALAKTDPARQKTVLYVTAEVIRQIAILTQPVMPAAAAKLLDSLGIPADERNFAALGGGTRIAPGTVLPAPQAVFPRYIEPSAA